MSRPFFFLPWTAAACRPAPGTSKIASAAPNPSTGNAATRDPRAAFVSDPSNKQQHA